MANFSGFDLGSGVMSSSAHIQRRPGDIENCTIGAHENDAVAVLCCRNDHLDSGCGARFSRKFNFVPGTQKPFFVGGIAQQGNARIPRVASRVVLVAADDDCNTDLLIAAGDKRNWQCF